MVLEVVTPKILDCFAHYYVNMYFFLVFPLCIVLARVKYMCM